MTNEHRDCGYSENSPGEASFFCACGSPLKKISERIDRGSKSGWLVVFQCYRTGHVVECGIPLGSPPPAIGRQYRIQPRVVEAYQAEERTVIAGPRGGKAIARPGDWIVTGVDGELYTVSMALFPRLYKATGEDDSPAQHSSGVRCRDGGACHHYCTIEDGGCFRERYCSPLGDDTWDEIEGEWLGPRTVAQDA